MPCERDLLEAIVNEPGLQTREFQSVTGWATNGQAAANLRKLGLIRRYIQAGTNQATEAGKIFMAIIIGKEAKARCLQSPVSLNRVASIHRNTSNVSGRELVNI